MKNLTSNNLRKAKILIAAKGYPEAKLENIAINCFAFAQNFGISVEEVIEKLQKI